VRAHVIVEGASRLEDDLGYANAQLASALATLGLDVIFAPWDQTEASCRAELAGFDNLAHLRVSSSPEVSAEFRIRQIWPPVWRRPHDQSRLVVIQPWEFGSLPMEWMEGVANADAILVPSNAVKAGYCQSGVPAEKVWVIPSATDLSRPSSQLRPRGRSELLELLFLGGSTYWQGIDILVEALNQLPQAMLARLKLTIKEAGLAVYSGEDSLIHKSLANAPKVSARTEVLREHVSRGEAVRLFDRADLLVHPYRADSRGLPVIEAMACGLPVLITGGGALDDYCGQGEGLHVGSGLTINDTPFVDNLLTFDLPYFRTPNVSQLAEHLAALVNGQYNLDPLQMAAWERAQSYQWSNAASAVLRVLEDLGRGITSTDQFTEVGAAVVDFLADPERGNWVGVARSLLKVGDIWSAIQLLEVAVEYQSDDLRIVSMAHRMRMQANAVHDVWSGVSWRLDLAAQRNDSVETSGNVCWREDDANVASDVAQYFTGCRRVLDLGCGRGSMLRTLRALGKDVVGVEAIPDVVHSLRQEGFCVYEGGIPDVLDELASECFDGVFMGNVVERLSTDVVLSLFGWVGAHLADGGTLVVKTPGFLVDSAGHTDFWRDPSRVRPYPLPLLKDLLEAAGFAPLRGGCRSLAPVAPTDILAVGRRRRRSVVSSVAACPRQSARRVVHYGLFSSPSGVGHASRRLFDEQLLAHHGFELVQVDMDLSEGLASSPQRVSFAESIQLEGDIAVIDVPVGWLPKVLPMVRARLRVVRLAYEATPLPSYLVHALRGIDEVWATSHYALESAVAGGVPREHLYFLPVQPDVPQFTPEHNPSGTVERLGSIFHFEPRKNPEVLLEAFAELIDRGCDVKFALKVSGITQSEFWAWAANLLGPKRSAQVQAVTELIDGTLSDEQISTFLARCDLFVLPTRGEGFGLPFLEAMTIGVPVVCPDVGGHRDFCDETTSFLVASRSAPCLATWNIPLFRESYWQEVDRDALVATLERALQDPELVASKGEASRARAAQLVALDSPAEASNRLAALLRR